MPTDKLHLFEIDNDYHWPVASGNSIVLARDEAHAVELFRTEEPNLTINSVTRADMSEARVIVLINGEY